MSTVKKWFSTLDAERKAKKEELDVDAVRAEAVSRGYAYVTVNPDMVSTGIVHAIKRVGFTHFVHGPGPRDFLFEDENEAILFKLTLS
jgi:hypothetical protein